MSTPPQAFSTPAPASPKKPDPERLENTEHRTARAAWEIFVNSGAKADIASSFRHAEEFAVAARARLGAILEKSAASEDDAEKKALALDEAVERGDYTVPARS